MGAGVDFTLQDAFGTGHRKRGDLLTQRLAGALDFLLDFRLGGGTIPGHKA